jgi:hypothetical protein
VSKYKITPLTKEQLLALPDDCDSHTIGSLDQALDSMQRARLEQMIEAERIANYVDHSKGIDVSSIKRNTCHDCGASEGEFHKPGCDMERCPFCGHQLISCSCCYELLGIDHSEGSWAYSNGLTVAQQEQWDEMLKKKGLVPYIVYPNTCCRCGELWPDMFMVPSSEWKKYIQKDARKEMLCKKCYGEIKLLIDTYAVDSLFKGHTSTGFPNLDSKLNESGQSPGEVVTFLAPNSKRRNEHI